MISKICGIRFRESVSTFKAEPRSKKYNWSAVNRYFALMLYVLHASRLTSAKFEFIRFNVYAFTTRTRTNPFEKALCSCMSYYGIKPREKSERLQC